MSRMKKQTPERVNSTPAPSDFFPTPESQRSDSRFWNNPKTARCSEIDGRTILGIVAGLLVLGLLFLTDDVTQRWALSIHTAWLDSLFKIAKNVGHTKFPLLLVIVFYALDRIRNNARFRRVSLLIPASVLLSGLIVLIAKPLFGRKETPLPVRAPLRGNTALHARAAAVIDQRWGRFPSGDSTVAFSTAGALAVEFPAFAPVLVLVAALAAFGRVYIGVHMASDVFAGGWLGWAVARWLARRFDAARSAKAVSGSRQRSREEEDIAP